MSVVKKHVRDEVVKINGSECFYCGKSLVVGSGRRENMVTIDHIVPRSHGGSDNVRNLVPSCKCCNEAKRDLSVEEFRLLRRAQLSEFAKKVPAEHIVNMFKMGAKFDMPEYKFHFEIS